MLQRNKAKTNGQNPELKFVSLRDDRGVLAFAEYGDPAGRPVIFCHGWPSSCTMAELTDAAACEVGARIISPDRPGICGSSPGINRRLLDLPPVVERLAGHLGLTDFHVIGISGGAPYALATAWSMPSQVRAISVVSSAPPIAELEDQSGLLPLYRWMLGVYRWRPQLLRFFFRLTRP